MAILRKGGLPYKKGESPKIKCVSAYHDKRRGDVIPAKSRCTYLKGVTKSIKYRGPEGIAGKRKGVNRCKGMWQLSGENGRCKRYKKGPYVRLN